MKTDTRFQITEKQFIFIMVGAATGSGILSLPRIATKEALQDGWISVLIGVFIPLLSLFLIEILCKKYPKDTISDISNKLLGNILGRVLTLGYIVHTMFIVIISIRIFVEITALYILPTTPLPVILAVYVLFIVYTIQNGSRLVGRFNELTFVILPISLLLILPSLSVCTYTNLLPVGEAGLSSILKASTVTAYSYASTELILVYYPMQTQKKKSFRNSVIALGIILFTYVFITVFSILVFGAEVMQNIIWPPILLYKIVHIPVIERLDLIFLVLWTSIAVRPSVNYTFASSYTITRFFNLKSEIYLKFASIAAGAIIFIIALIPEDLQQVFDLADIFGYGYYIVGIGYPIILLAASLLRKGETIKNV